MSVKHSLKTSGTIKEDSLVFHNIYIFGLGMMGGSLAYAIKRKKHCKKILHMILVKIPVIC